MKWGSCTCRTSELVDHQRCPLRDQGERCGYSEFILPPVPRCLLVHVDHLRGRFAAACMILSAGPACAAAASLRCGALCGHWPFRVRGYGRLQTGGPGLCVGLSLVLCVLPPFVRVLLVLCVLCPVSVSSLCVSCVCFTCSSLVCVSRVRHHVHLFYAELRQVPVLFMLFFSIPK